MRAWPTDATVAHLIFVDHQTLPTADDLAGAVEHAVRKGARALRTSAMFPDAADIVLGGGFTPIDRLALLRRPLTEIDDLPAPPVRIRPMRAWHLSPCAGIDREAFGLMWANSPASLRDIRTATPLHRARLTRTGRRITGFVVSGAAADTGYLQRLAVAADARRCGIARALVADAMRWMRDQDLTAVMVNTGVTNTAALELYASLGFHTLPDELTIAELRLT
jgi:ribosomal protein S18 acetylase RimI-like enzyme